MFQRGRIIAFGGIFGALNLTVLYFAAVLPTSRIFLYGLSSIFAGVMVIEAGVKSAWIFYVSTSILAYVIIPNKVGIVPYILFFGLYGIVKYYIEGLNNRVIQALVKGAYFLLSMFCTAVLVRELFMGNVYSNIPTAGLTVIGILVFFIYDYVYTQFVVYYETRLRKRI